MEAPKFAPSGPAPREKSELEVAIDRIDDCMMEIAEKDKALALKTTALDSMIEQAERTAKELAEAKRILKDLVAAGVLTDGFMTNAVGHSLLNQAAAAKKFLEAHP